MPENEEAYSKTKYFLSTIFCVQYSIIPRHVREHRKSESSSVPLSSSAHTTHVPRSFPPWEVVLFFGNFSLFNLKAVNHHSVYMYIFNC